MNPTIRFAPVVRVSTEKQAEMGESLSTQKKQIVSFVQTLGGKIPEECWIYSGQEHATPDQERQKIDRLLEDSGKGIFDAVIVCDPSRWSRDNLKSKQGLAILKNNGIRFFVGTMEYDLADPTAELILGVFTEFNQFHAREQTRKSILNRIERARRGVPTGGKLPYGRIYDKDSNSWSLDREKADGIAWAAKEYLNGTSSIKLGQALGMNVPNLWKILTKRSNDQWSIKFKKPDLNIDETIEIKIPPLLTDETIDAIKRKAKANKTYSHGHIKYRYLLSRMIFCGHCGYAMFGQTNHSRNRYYRHARHRKNKCEHPGFWVRADEVETAVFIQLFSTLGNIPKLEAAIQDAVPNKEYVEHLRETKKRLSMRIDGLKKRKDRLVDAVSEGLLVGQAIKIKMDEILAEEAEMARELSLTNAQLAHLPSKAQIRKRASLWEVILRDIHSRYPSIAKMSFADKRQLLELALGGNDPKGRRYGVYVKKGEDESISYEIKGNLPTLEFAGTLPVSDLDIIDALGLDQEFQDKLDVKAEIEELKQNILGQCDAYNRLRIHQRRRERPAPGLRRLAGKAGPPCTGFTIPA